MTLIEELRKPKLPLMGKQVAVFDASMTALAGYLVAKRMEWNTPLTIGGMFLLGHITHLGHKAGGDKQTGTCRDEDGKFEKCSPAKKPKRARRKKKE